MKLYGYGVPVTTEVLRDTVSIADLIDLFRLPEPERTVEHLRRGWSVISGEAGRWNTAELVEKNLNWWDDPPEDWRPGWTKVRPDNYYAREPDCSDESHW